MMLDKFNAWYDSQKQAHRFAMFMVAMSIAVFPLQIGLSLRYKPAIIFGLIVFVFMVVVGMSRAARFGWNRVVVVAMDVALLAIIAGTMLLMATK